MHEFLRPLGACVLAFCLTGCATSSLQQTWKSPSHKSGPVRNVAVLAVDERGLVRVGLENRFVRDLRLGGQNAVATHGLMTLNEIKSDKQAAARKVVDNGADSVLIVRLVDQATYANEVRATPALFTPTIDGYENVDWYGYYTVSFTDMGTIWGSTKSKVYLDTSLFDLKTSKRIWSCQTLTVLKEDMDRFAEADVLVAKLVGALRKDGFIH